MAACSPTSQQAGAPIRVADPRESRNDAATWHDGGSTVLVEAEAQAGDPTKSSQPSPAALRDACRQLSPPPSSFCESMSDVRRQCTRLSRRLPIAAAAGLVACLIERSGRPAVCGNSPSSCFEELVQKTVLHPVGDAAHPEAATQLKRCQEIVDGCKGRRWRSKNFDLATCRKGLQVVAKSQGDDLLTCMRESCGISYCAYSLKESGP